MAAGETDVTTIMLYENDYELVNEQIEPEDAEMAEIAVNSFWEFHGGAPSEDVDA